MSDEPRQPHVLALNDAQELLDLMRELRESEGYRVTTSLVHLPLEQIREIAPDVIVFDLLAGDNQAQGWHFLTAVRLDPALARIPLVLCTAAVEVVRDTAMAE